MLVRRGEVVHALKDTCSHAGGPLSAGELKSDTITCPWHWSRLPHHRWRGRARTGRLAPGRRTRARVTDGQVELQGPHD